MLAEMWFGAPTSRLGLPGFRDETSLVWSPISSITGGRAGVGDGVAWVSLAPPRPHVGGKAIGLPQGQCQRTVNQTLRLIRTSWPGASGSADRPPVRTACSAGCHHADGRGSCRHPGAPPPAGGAVLPQLRGRLSVPWKPSQGSGDHPRRAGGPAPGVPGGRLCRGDASGCSR